MQQNLILTTLLFVMGFLFAMEEIEKSADPRILTQIDKLPKDVGQLIKKVVTIENLPADSLLPILVQFSAGATLQDSLKAMKNFRLISRRFNDLIKDEIFVRSLTNYWSKKYQLPRAYIPVAWLLTIQDIPDELLMTILDKLITGKKITDDLAAINKLRFISKRFDTIINNIEFITPVIEYLSQKYKLPGAHIAVIWDIPGAREWLKLQEITDLDVLPRRERVGVYKLTDTPIFLATYLTPKRKEAIEILLQKGIDPKQFSAISGESLLSRIVAYTNWIDLANLLINKGVDVNMQDGSSYGNTPLINAIYYSNLPMVRFLLENRADANKKNSKNESPLDVFRKLEGRVLVDIHDPKNQKRPQIEKLLLEHGAISAQSGC